MFKRLSRTPLTEEVIELLKGKITSNSISVGERLPTESQLVEDLGVSRSTIREVLITLQAEGFIKIKRGIGAFVVDKAEFDRQKFLTWFEQNEFKIQELLEVRMAIEPYAAFLATTRIKETEILQLEQVNHELEASIKEGHLNNIVEKDAEFHNIIFKSTRNHGLVFIYTHFIPGLDEYRSRAFSPPFNPNLAVDAHKKILEAIKSGKSEMAKHEMLNHIIESQNDVIETAKRTKRKAN